MGYPRQGMPEIGMTGREGPPDPLDRDPILNIAVLCYVYIVIVINEFAVIDLPECQEGGSR